MSIEITAATDIDPTDWNSYVEKSSQANLFHQWEALEAMADHANATLHPLVGYKGQEPVGIFPLFEVAKGPFTGVFSPPPPLWVQNLGPAMLDKPNLKQRKAEERVGQFVDKTFEWVDEHLDTKFLRVRTASDFNDIRSFQWNGCTVTPVHTYLVDLSPGPDEVLMNFSSDARRNIGNGDETDVVIGEGGYDDIRPIVELVRDRYEEQGEAFRLPSGFVQDLYTNLPDGQIRPYTCRYDDELVGGMIVLDYADTVYRWQGGVKPSENVGYAINDLLDWRVMADAMGRDKTKYDLVGADNARLNGYKAKFCPDLQTFYVVEDGTWTVTQLTKVYQQLSSIPMLP